MKEGEKRLLRCVSYLIVIRMLLISCDCNKPSRYLKLCFRCRWRFVILTRGTKTSLRLSTDEQLDSMKL